MKLVATQTGSLLGHLCALVLRTGLYKLLCAKREPEQDTFTVRDRAPDQRTYCDSHQI